ncbi:MAG TPA: 30S ribosome-binding factor RbfA [Bryobacteraceae bacterium]|nr:30S ribosome-binding factor RbfA [Bryobacteraceae bacterium]
MDPRRTERMAETLREELEELITCELTDPRLRVTGVAEVLLSPDGRVARARLLMNGSAEEQKESLAAVDHARGYIRRELAERVDIFRLPEIQFEAAVPAELAPRVPHLLKRVRRGRPR